MSPPGSWRCGTHRGRADGGAGGPEAAQPGGGARTQEDARRLFGPDYKFAVTQSAQRGAQRAAVRASRSVSSVCPSGVGSGLGGAR